MKLNELPALDRVLELLDYCPESGIFRWRRRKQKAAGSMTRGYVQIGIDGTQYMAHRLAWLIMTGSPPTLLIDHRDGCKSNNRFSNLRESDFRSNGENIYGPTSANTHGFLGASFSRRDGKWHAYIRTNYKKKNLGGFASPEQAHAAYVEAKRKMHPAGNL